MTREHLSAPNVNMITCGGQATIPMAHAVSRVTPVPYAESSPPRPPGRSPDEITSSVHAMVAEVAQYVPGYALRADPQFDPPADDWSGWARVALFL